MRLAWRNLLHDKVRLTVTVLGVTFATFLMIFQGSLLAGFLHAASAIVDATDAEIWITGRGVPCFDFSAPIPERFQALARGIPGVASVTRIASGFAGWKKPDGAQQTVILVGADSEPTRFPMPTATPGSAAMIPDAVVVDESDLDLLGLAALPADVEIGNRHARVARAASGFGSFIGSPYVFTTHRAAADYAGLGAETTTFLLVRVEPGREIADVIAGLRAALPEVDVWSREEFARRSRAHWVLQTGAGGAILTAAILGFVVGVVVVSQTIYSTTMENVDEFATLNAMGASRGFVCRIVLVQAMASGAIGCVLGIGGTLPVIGILRDGIPWIRTPFWLPPAMLGASLLMCGLASVLSIRAALAAEPAKVFRA